MKIQFELNEKNIEFSFSKLSGAVKLIVDGDIKDKKMMLMGGDLSTACNLDSKRLEVTIKQALFGAMFRSRTYEVYYDGKLIKTYDKKGKEISSNI